MGITWTGLGVLVSLWELIFARIKAIGWLYAVFLAASAVAFSVFHPRKQGDRKAMEHDYLLVCGRAPSQTTCRSVSDWLLAFLLPACPTSGGYSSLTTLSRSALRAAQVGATQIGTESASSTIVAGEDWQSLNTTNSSSSQKPPPSKRSVTPGQRSPLHLFPTKRISS